MTVEIITGPDAAPCRCSHRAIEHDALGLRPCRKTDCFCRRFREPEAADSPPAA